MIISNMSEGGVSEKESFSCFNKVKLFFKSVNVSSLGKQWYSNDSKALFLAGAFFVIWLVFEKRLLGWIDNEIYKGVTKGYEHSTLAFIIVSCFGLIYGTYKVVKILQYRRFTSYKRLIFIIVFLLIYWYSRCLGYYSYKSEYFNVNLFDVISGFLLVFIFIAICSNLTKEDVKENIVSTKGLKRDESINKFKDDSFGFGEKVKAFVVEIFNTDCSKRLSIGINGKWGEGKSSYANLMKIEFKSDKYKKEFIVLDFNPRHSKSVNSIQFDFFQMLYEALSVYDSRFSTTFKKYLKAIQVFDQHKILDFIQLGSDVFFAKEEEKQEINKAIKRLGKRIIIFIEDMDRLLAEEIMEVFKLIDGTAAFSNFVFITCFDKEHVSKVISKLYVEGEDTYFSDKFFDVEKRIPLIESQSLLAMLKDKLRDSGGGIDFIGLSDSEKNDIDKTFDKHKKLIFDILLHPRDIIRFVNMFKLPYLYFRESILVEDYFLLSLLKYKYNDVYRQLFYKKIVYRGNLFFFDDSKALNHNQMYHNIEENVDIKDNVDYQIVKLLFERNHAELMAINHSDSYMVYFREYYISDFSLTAMKDIIESGLTQKQKVIDKFITANDTSFFHEFLYKVMGFKDKVITTKDVFYNYLDILIYVVSIVNDFNLKSQLLSMLSKEDVRQLSEIGLISSEDEYKKDLKVKLKGDYPNALYYVIGSWIKDLINKGKGYTSVLIFDKEELLEINKSILKDLIEKERVYNKKYLEVLYNCVASINLTNDRIINLDKDSCEKVRELIEENPQEYLKNFINLNQRIIACEPFCVQIFGSEEDVDSFLNSQAFDSYLGINRIRNVWKWFRLNDCNHINRDFIIEDWNRMLENDFENEAQLADDANVLFIEFNRIKNQLNDVLELVKGFSPNYFNAENFISFCRDAGIDMKKLYMDLENLLKVVIETKEIDLKASRIDYILTFEWMKLKLYSGGQITELENVVKRLSSM
ncbi:MAG: KAP family NTPase [Flavobacteriaceae bacterium]|nr:KAP family NTPase [Flavobacteriaceae bacterium]